MAKQKYERTKPHINIGTIGHVDHGKTTLTRLTKHRKRRKEESPSPPHTLNMRPRTDTTRT